MTTANEDGNTLLHFLAAGTNGDMLASHKADINVKNKLGQTPLHVAYKHGRSENVIWLIANGADTSVKDNDGNVPEGLDPGAVAERR